MVNLALLVGAVLATAPVQGPAAPNDSDDDLITLSERSGHLRTGRYDEVVTLCHRFAQRYPGQVRCDNFGITPERRQMLSLVVSLDGMLTPERARKAQRPVVMAQGGIHAGEVDGKDAGFLLLRELLAANDPVLAKVTFVFIPVLNVDGHERFGPNHRPNQRGPEETGWRVTGQNLNLNRDYVKADTKEMQHLLRYLGAWDPILYLDLHATNGAQFQHDVAVMLEPLGTGPAAMTAEATHVRDGVFHTLRGQGHLPLPFYPSFNVHDDPKSGAALGQAPPRFSQTYRALKNRYGVLVETHSWRPYPQRVRATAHVLRAFLQEAASRGDAWLKLAQAADAEDARGAAGEEIPMTWQPSGPARTFDFQGYAYAHLPSDVSGSKVVRYDETKPEVWKLPYVEGLSPKQVAQAPAQYVVPGGWAHQVEPLLRLHGFTFETLRAPRSVDVERFRATRTTFSAAPYEGRQRLEVEGEWEKARVQLPEGSLLIPAAQPGRRPLVHLFEPNAPDSLMAWGTFNAAFEQKEYLEDYVIEPFARALLAKDPKVRAAFEARLRDPAFAKSPQARLRFFAERHPAWDGLLNVYPVYRTASGSGRSAPTATHGE